MMRRIAFFGVMALAVAALWAEAHARVSVAPDPNQAKLAPDFILTDQAGKEHSLRDYRGKIVVLEWINPDCPFVQRHYREGTMKRLAEKYDEMGVVWLAINTTHYFNQQKNKAFHQKHKLPYPILNDAAGDVGRAYGAKTTPDMRIIDPSGRIVYIGGIDDDPRGRKDEPTNYVDQALQELLAGEQVSRDKTKPYGCSVKYAAPNFTLKDQDGKEVSLADLRGKTVVLEWVNPDCPFVQRHYREKTMQTLAEKYDDRGVVWLAVNSTHYFNRKKNKTFHDKHDLSYAVLDDSSGKVGKAYHAKTTPDMRVIDPTGKIVYSGAIDDDPRGRKENRVNYVARALEEQLAGKKISKPETKPYGCSVKYPPKEKKETAETARKRAPKAAYKTVGE